MPCSFGLLRFRWSGAGAPVQRPPRSDRDCPVDTAGARCLWHAGGTAGENDVACAWRRRSPLAGQVRLVPGDDGLVGNPGSGAAASGGRGSRSVESPAQLPSVGSRNDDLSSDYTSAGETSPPGRLPAFRGATGPDRHPAPYAPRSAKSICCGHIFISLWPRIIQNA